MNAPVLAGLFVRSVRSGGDGRSAAVLPSAARRAPGLLRRQVGYLRALPVLRHLAGAGDQRRHLRGVGGNTARRNGSGAAQRRARADPPLHPMPFHANFDAPIYDGVRRCTSGRSGRSPSPRSPTGSATLANERLDELLPRGAFDLTQEYGGIVAASVVCELLGLPVDLAPEVLATVNAGSLAQPGSGVEVANARPGYLEYLVPIVAAPPRRRCRRRTADRRQPDRLPAARRLGVQRHRGRHPDAGRLHRRHRNRAEDRRARAVGAEPATRPTGRRACRSRRQRAGRARGDDPVLRARAMVRPHRAQAVHHSRHHDRTGAADHHAARVGQPRRARVPRPRRVHLEPAHRAPAGVRPRTALLPRRTPGPPGDRDHGDRMAQAGCPTTRIHSEAASRPPSSFQWGWNNIPVEV